MARKQGLNTRKALAGLDLMRGKALGPALRDNGYAPSTAKTPAYNGISADRCLEEAKKLEPEGMAETLLGAARRVMAAKLERLESSQKQLDGARGGEIARMLEVSEKYYGGGAGLDSKEGARQFGSRIAWLQEAMERYREVSNGDAAPLDVVVSESE